MMNMKRLCSTFVLTLMLATYALAGGIECPIVEPTPTAAPTTLCGGIECPTTQPTPDATGDATSVTATVAEVALALVGSVVALF